jgi:hypothetical protein
MDTTKNKKNTVVLFFKKGRKKIKKANTNAGNMYAK